MRVPMTRFIYAVALSFIALLAVQPSWASETLLTTQTPMVTNWSDGPTTNYELGMAFTSDIAGQITAVRFWKNPGETGTHAGRIWSCTGQLLASVTFTNETASGWQTQSLYSALTILPNTTYVVSVNTGGTYYAFTSFGLSSQVTNDDLSSVVGSNGRYGNPGTFPTSTHNATNYFRDVVFVPAVALQSGSNCNGIYTGGFNGNLTVTYGQTCNLANAGVTGNITLLGGSLATINSAITGNVQVQGGGVFSIGPSTAIGGNLQVQNMPQGAAQSKICGATMHGDLQFQNNGAPVLIGAAAPVSCAGNNIGGNLNVQNNTAATIMNGNIVTGNIQVQNNTGATSVNGNIVTGNLQDQNNTGPTQVFSNIVGNGLQCQQDSSITGGGNTSAQKQGQCSAF